VPVVSGNYSLLHSKNEKRNVIVSGKGRVAAHDYAGCIQHIAQRTSKPLPFTNHRAVGLLHCRLKPDPTPSSARYGICALLDTTARSPTVHSLSCPVVTPAGQAVRLSRETVDAGRTKERVLRRVSVSLDFKGVGSGCARRREVTDCSLLAKLLWRDTLL
jgi:hypothetical protein